MPVTNRPRLYSVNKETAAVLLRLAQGSFHVPKSQRTRIERRAVRQFQKRRQYFTVINGVLHFDGRKVLNTDDVKNATKRTFKTNLGSGVKATWTPMNKDSAGGTRRKVKATLKNWPECQQTFPRFENKVPMKPVKSDYVNERWQIDLKVMNRDKVDHEGKTYRYILCH